MLVAAALGAVLIGQPLLDPAIGTFGDACLATTPMTRASISAVASAQGWDVGEADTPDHLEWRDYYRAGRTIVRLDQYRVTDESSGERICVVLVGEAPAGWTEQVSELRSNGQPVGEADAYDTERYQLPPRLALTVWDLPDGSRIHALVTDSGLLELSVNYPAGS